MGLRCPPGGPTFQWVVTASRGLHLRQGHAHRMNLSSPLHPLCFFFLLFLFSSSPNLLLQKGRIKSDSGFPPELSLFSPSSSRTVALFSGNRFLLLPFFSRLRSRGENFDPALFPHQQLRLFTPQHIDRLSRQYRQDGQVSCFCSSSRPLRHGCHNHRLYVLQSLRLLARVTPPSSTSYPARS